MKISALGRGGSSPLSACFHPSATAINEDLPSALPSPSNPSYISTSGDATTTCQYHTNVGVFFLSWSRSFLRRSLHLHFYSCNSTNCYLHSLDCYRHSIPFAFRLEIKPLTFWRKNGSKKLSRKPDIRVVWDLTHAKFGSGPDPESGFYVAVFVSGEVGLLVGGGNLKQRPRRQILVSKKENLFGNRVYSTKIMIQGKLREISIDVKVVNDDASLRFSVDDKSVLKISQLQWKFRGNTKIVIDGVTIQISWDVFNWLFGGKDKVKPDKIPAVFLLRFENQEVEGNDVLMMNKRVRDDVILRKENCRTPSFWASTYSHWSSSRMSSVMEWSSCREEDERSFGSKSWFSLIIYAWRK
ncbi:unnamed protein product [Arabidopsis thaliana]|uniref:Uncharacterized protein n=3 Tax=Arabidopsis TaxID=3701 RepID=A0A178VVP4_ARATH|nr:hypothetical protein ISN45_At02g019160 [Arabidopsis thaliana x Arabidopsis arenosa]KAG7641984.1 hypothetical protein ISN44_As02g019560 [Arabidopsis suecica]OAP09908.1 hypothetical protein AXX17_AT2G20940 [Arabidopsis thaliana]CAA0371340.1 unnamed protein product [Arabidopsis thaliana]VYS53446.1 unnamed protein product [Arabidopsis thaliana]